MFANPQIASQLGLVPQTPPSQTHAQTPGGASAPDVPSRAGGSTRAQTPMLQASEQIHGGAAVSVGIEEPPGGTFRRPASAPSSHAQKVAELHYDQFCMHRCSVGAASRHMLHGPQKKKATASPAVWSQLPDAWRPALPEVEAEIDETGFSLPEAVVSLVAGRDTVRRLCATGPGKGSGSYASGVLNLQAWVSIVRRAGVDAAGANTGRSVVRTTPRPQTIQQRSPLPGEALMDQIIASVALILGVGGVWSVDARDSMLREAPEMLRLFPQLFAVSLGGNMPLRSVDALCGCTGKLRAIDLSDCAALQDLSPLGALPSLEFVDLSRCVAVQDIRPLLIPPGDSVASMDSQGIRGGSCYRAGCDYPSITAGASRPTSSERAAEGLRSSPASAAQSVPWPSGKRSSSQEVSGHRTLQWLLLDSCLGLRFGIEDMTICQALMHVDLYGCLQADPEQCLAATCTRPLRVFVWPSSAMLERLAKEQAWPQRRRDKLVASACKSAAKKLELARGSRQPTAAAGLPAQRAPARRTELASAVKAAEEFGLPTAASGLADAVAEAAGNSSRSPLRGGGGGSTAAAAVAAGATPDSRISPSAFARAIRSAKPEGLGCDACALFRILDRDSDGGISVEELCALGTGPTLEAETDSAVAVLLRRHAGDCGAAAADLAGGRTAVDQGRIQECLIVAGVEEKLACRVAAAIVHCAAGHRPATGAVGALHADVEKALCHALGGYAVAQAAELVAAFCMHLRGRFHHCEEAFSVLDTNRRGFIGWEEFQWRVRESIKWPQAQTAGACEAIFRVLDVDGTGIVGAKEFGTLERFDTHCVMQAMTAAGIALACGPHPVMQEAGETREGGCCSATRHEFAAAWKELAELCSGTTASIAFGLLDHAGNNCLGHEELMVLADSLPRRAEAAALGDLELLLRTHYGSLEAAHAAMVLDC